MSDTKKLDHQFHNFKLALKKLNEFTQEPIENDRDRAGIIQAFEFTFEQCWKYFQKKGELIGEVIPGPKPALEIALRYGWIKTVDEEIWLEMLKDQNMTSHLYREDVSLEILNRITQ